MSELETMLNLTLEQIADFIENNNMNGTSATASLGEMSVGGEVHQIQVRLEKDPKMFIGPADVVGSEVLFEIDMDEDA